MQTLQAKSSQETQQNELCNWLMSTCRTISAKPCQVVIGKEKWEGAVYETLRQVKENETIVESRIAKVGDEYKVTRIYCIGKLPKLLLQTVSRKGIFTFDSPFEVPQGFKHSNEFMLICYFERNEKNNYRPFGKSFILQEHHMHGVGFYKDLPIDYFEKFPAKREPMKIIM